MTQPRSLNNRGKSSRAGLAAIGLYAGSISVAGAISNAPAGWTGGAPAASVFTVTHNLGLTANAYEVIAVCTQTNAQAMVTARSANSFQVTTSDLATPTVADRAFSFLLIRSDGE